VVVVLQGECKINWEQEMFVIYTDFCWECGGENDIG